MRTVLAWLQTQARNAELRLVILILVLFGVSIFWNAHTQSATRDTLEQYIQAPCSFWQDLAPLPITVPKGANKPAVVGVKLIAHSRTSYVGQGCTAAYGKLPPADPSLIRWARFYHIPYN